MLHGLDYRSTNTRRSKRDSGQKSQDLGINGALEAVRKGMVKGAEAFIWSEAIDAVGRRIAAVSSVAELEQLRNLEARLLNEFDPYRQG